MPRGFEGLHGSCVLMLKRCELTDEWGPPIYDALAEAKKAHQERNRVIHDMWLPALDETGTPQPDRFFTSKLDRHFAPVPMGSRTVADLRAVLLALRRANIRLCALTMALDFLTPYGSGAFSGMEDRLRRTVSNRFRIVGDGAYQLLDAE